MGVCASTVMPSSPMTRSASAGATLEGKTSVAPRSRSDVAEPIPAMVCSGMTNSHTSSSRHRNPHVYAGAVEMR